MALFAIVARAMPACSRRGENANKFCSLCSIIFPKTVPSLSLMIYFSYIMKYCSWYVPEMPGKLARSMLESLLSLTKTGAQGLRPKAAAGTAPSQQSNRSPARVPGQPKNCISRATICLSSRCLRAIALTTRRRACQEHKGLCCSQCRSWQTWSQYQAALQAHLGT